MYFYYFVLFSFPIFPSLFSHFLFVLIHPLLPLFSIFSLPPPSLTLTHSQVLPFFHFIFAVRELPPYYHLLFYIIYYYYSLLFSPFKKHLKKKVTKNRETCIQAGPFSILSYSTRARFSPSLGRATPPSSSQLSSAAQSTCKKKKKNPPSKRLVPLFFIFIFAVIILFTVVECFESICAFHRITRLPTCLSAVYISVVVSFTCIARSSSQDASDQSFFFCLWLGRLTGFFDCTSFSSFIFSLWFPSQVKQDGALFISRHKQLAIKGFELTKPFVRSLPFTYTMYPSHGPPMPPPQKPETFMLSNEAQQSLPHDAQVALQQVDNRTISWRKPASTDDQLTIR